MTGAIPNSTLARRRGSARDGGVEEVLVMLSFIMVLTSLPVRFVSPQRRFSLLLSAQPNLEGK